MIEGVAIEHAGRTYKCYAVGGPSPGSQRFVVAGVGEITVARPSGEAIEIRPITADDEDILLVVARLALRRFVDEGRPQD